MGEISLQNHANGCALVANNWGSPVIVRGSGNTESLSIASNLNLPNTPAVAVLLELAGIEARNLCETCPLNDRRGGSCRPIFMVDSNRNLFTPYVNTEGEF